MFCCLSLGWATTLKCLSGLSNCTENFRACCLSCYKKLMTLVFPSINLKVWKECRKLIYKSLNKLASLIYIRTWYIRTLSRLEISVGYKWIPDTASVPLVFKKWNWKSQVKWHILAVLCVIKPLLIITWETPICKSHPELWKTALVQVCNYLNVQPCFHVGFKLLLVTPLFNVQSKALRVFVMTAVLSEWQAFWRKLVLNSGEVVLRAC